ncbi:MAG: carboxypeptidase-like regulatory domain-containing protein [Bacteroidales bacterium]|nr:carboxypeptidase-like regulatory domain-containing protein [Bacteroidales bacterium]
MKIKIYITVILLTLFFRAEGQTEELKITGDFRNISFAEFAAFIESDFSVRVFYNPVWVKDIVINISFREVSLRSAMEQLLLPDGISFYIDKTGFIVLTGKYRVKEPGVTEPLSDTMYIYRPQDDTQQLTASKDEFQIIEIGRPTDNMAGDVTISGYMRNSETGEPVIGAAFIVDEIKTGTMTNQYGYYSLTMPKGSYHAQISCLGMKTIIRQINLYATGTLDIDLKENLIPLGSVTVTTSGGYGFQKSMAGLEKLDIRTIKLIPSGMGEPDIIKTTLLLPGVQSVGEGSAGFHVRGGSSDQNLVLLYDAPVFNSSHFFGFFSAVNSDIISDIALYKGGIPAKYGGRISSVLNIVAKDGNKKEFAGTGGISPVTAHLMIEGPIIKDRTSFLLAGRSTYSNWVLKMIDDAQLKRSRIGFYDSNFRLVHEINKQNNLELSGYISHDEFKFNNDTLYSYNNIIASAKWRHIFTEKLFGVVSLNHSNYNYDITSESEKVFSFGLRHNIDYTDIKAHFTWYPNYRHQADFGVDIGRYKVLPGEIYPAGDSSLVIPSAIQRQNAISPSFFISDEINLLDNLNINAGIRLSTFFSTGPSTVYIYHPGFPRSRSSITDTIYYGRGKTAKRYIVPELRLSVNYLISNRSSVKLSYNNTAQFIHQISNTASISPTDIWVLSDTHIKPQRGEQAAIGIYTSLLNNSLELSVEGYYKRIKNIIDFKGGASLLLNENLETDIVNLNGNARGLEFMIRKSNGRMNGWLSYTYSSIMVRSATPFPEEEINSGAGFPANYDKPHDLTLVFNYIFSRRISFSSTYSYSTGRPITYPVAAYNFGGNNILHYSDRNQYRIPDYSRLDIALTIDGNLKSKKLAHSTLTFSVINLLGRENVYSIYFKTEQNIVNGYKLSIFARPIPSISYTFKF